MSCSIISARKPAEALMVGDTHFDMAMAQQAGMARVAVSYGAHHRISCCRTSRWLASITSVSCCLLLLSPQSSHLLRRIADYYSVFVRHWQPKQIELSAL
jgi:hypothetical protein